MKKWNSGMTLMELLASLLVLTLLMTAMGTSMDAALDSYQDSLFQSNSSMLIGIVNTTLGDLLRYAQDIQISEEGIAFTNAELGVYNGRLTVSEDGTLQILDLTGRTMDLLNAGVYAGLYIRDFAAVYVPPDTDGKRGGYFEILYTIENGDATKVRHAETVVRVLNAG